MVSLCEHFVKNYLIQLTQMYELRQTESEMLEMWATTVRFGRRVNVRHMRYRYLINFPNRLI